MSFTPFNDPPHTDIYTLSLHDALPISAPRGGPGHSECNLHSGKNKAENQWLFLLQSANPELEHLTPRLVLLDSLARLAAASARGFLRRGPRRQEFLGTRNDAINQSLRRQACGERDLQRLGL